MQKGGGIHCLQAGRLNLTHTRVVDNYAGVGGGGLCVMVVVVVVVAAAAAMPSGDDCVMIARNGCGGANGRRYSDGCYGEITDADVSRNNVDYALKRTDVGGASWDDFSTSEEYGGGLYVATRSG